MGLPRPLTERRRQCTRAENDESPSLEKRQRRSQGEGVTSHQEAGEAGWCSGRGGRGVVAGRSVGRGDPGRDGALSPPPNPAGAREGARCLRAGGLAPLTTAGTPAQGAGASSVVAHGLRVEKIQPLSVKIKLLACTGATNRLAISVPGSSWGGLVPPLERYGEFGGGRCPRAGGRAGGSQGNEGCVAPEVRCGRKF